MHLAPLIQDLAIIFGVCGPVGLFFYRLKQPLVLGYILSGMLIGPYLHKLPLINDLPSIRIWGELGVICLMFSLGLEFSFRKLVTVGFSATITALIEVSFMFVVGFFSGRFFNWSFTDSLFLGAMLCISSTTIIVKALSDLGLNTKRFAEMIFAVLIVEDLFAILLLVGLSTFGKTQSISTIEIILSALRLILIVGGWFVFGYFLVPRFVQYVGKVGNNEILTLLSFGLCLGLVVFANRFGYSTALGAFIMGSILAESREAHRISESLKPLKDLFAAIFFVSVGMLVDPHSLWEHAGAVSLLCGVTVVGKVLSSSFGALMSGQSLRTATQVGFGLAQIGEFSFIIASLGDNLKITSSFLYPIAILVSLFTTFTTPYMIRFSQSVAQSLEKGLPVRLLAIMNRYGSWMQERQVHSSERKDFFNILAFWSINALVVSLIFIICSKFLSPVLQKNLSLPGFWMHTILWAAPALFASPFLWAMFFLFQKSNDWRIDIAQLSLPRSLVVFGFRFFTLVLLSLLSLFFLPFTKVALGLCILIILIFFFFLKQIEKSYHWFESQFLSTFEKMEEIPEAFSTESLRHLAPWDVHLVKLRTHPNSEVVLKKISDLCLRTTYGVNIVALQRGTHTSVAPQPKQVFLPYDELLVLGTDDQIDQTRHLFEASSYHEEGLNPISGYELRNLKIQAGSFLVGNSIRNSGVREKFECIIVGMEKDQSRFINPESDLLLQEGDGLWIVGSQSKLKQLLSYLASDGKKEQ